MAIFNSFLYVYQRVTHLKMGDLCIISHNAFDLCIISHQIELEK
jgi:hypothetical protein